MSIVSDSVAALAVNYFGPAARKFLERQTITHLNGMVFDTLQKKDLPELANWINVSGSLIIDKNKARELADKVARL